MPKVNTVDIFGLSGQRQTPQAYDRRKKIADTLMANGDEKPVSYNFAQGLSIVAPKIIGGILGKRADDEEEREEQEANDTMMSALKGLDASGEESGWGSGESEVSATTRRSGGSGGSSRSYAANERRQRAIARLVEKGYSQHAAEGIADNLGDESAFNTKAVGDNGTAFGIAQWRGPRFQNLKRFAASQGKDWQDFDTQVDFVDHEMKNRLDDGAGIAYAKLQKAGSADEAYNHFVTHYERPSAKNLQKRLRQIRQRVASGEGLSGSIDEPPPAPQIDTRAFDAQIQSGTLMMRNPRTREAGYRLYQQGIQGKAEARREMQKYAYEGQKDAYKYRRERADKLEDRDWEIERDDAKFQREQDAKTFTLSPGQRIVDRDGNVIAEGPPKTDADIEVGPDGAVRVKTGKLTEVQSKDIGFFDRAAGAELELREREDALLDFASKNAGNLPLIGNYMKTPEYRQAEVPAREFLGALLRKDTGAAVTPQEFTLYGAMYLPQPGDDADTMRLKRAARTRAIKAIKKGLGTAEALAESYPDLFDGKSIEPKKKGGGDGAGGYKKGDVVGDYRFKGGDPTKQENWEKVRWN